MAKKERKIVYGVEIEKVAAEGSSIAKIDGKVVFVPHAIPGDIVDIQLRNNRKSYTEGFILNLVKPSPDRVDPFCSHYGVCGGCKWQILPYPLQLKYKQQQVEDQFRRIGKFEFPALNKIIGSEKTEFYRNKLEYSFSHRRWIPNIEDVGLFSELDLSGLGFHISGHFDRVLDIEKCYLQDEPSNSIRLFIRQFARDNSLSFYNLRANEGFLRNIIIRTTSTNQVMLIVIFGKEDADNRKLLLDAIIERFPQITSLYYVINTKLNNSIADQEAIYYWGKEAISEKMDDLIFRIGPKSFYQTNSRQAHILYGVVKEMAGLTGDEIVYDLYTGTGTIALFLSGSSSRIIGIEYVPEAIEDAKINASNNGIENCQFFAGDMKDVLNEEFIASHGKPDVVILDPPRSGIHPNVSEAILKAAPTKIVYVSCNPATQARDIATMTDSYQVKEITPVDMFPHTHHVENVVLLERIEAEN